MPRLILTFAKVYLINDKVSDFGTLSKGVFTLSTPSENLAIWLEKSKLSQVDLATKLGKSRTTIQNWLLGKYQIPRDVVEAIDKALVGTHSIPPVPESRLQHTKGALLSSTAHTPPKSLALPLDPDEVLKSDLLKHIDPAKLKNAMDGCRNARTPWTPSAEVLASWFVPGPTGKSLYDIFIEPYPLDDKA